MVIFINCFEVAAGREDEFLSFFRDVNALMAAQPGYRGHRMHRALRPDATFGFVNYVSWDSVAGWRDAHALPAFRELLGRPETAAFSSTPALFEVIDARGEIEVPVGG